MTMVPLETPTQKRLAHFLKRRRDNQIKTIQVPRKVLALEAYQIAPTAQARDITPVRQPAPGPEPLGTSPVPTAQARRLGAGGLEEPRRSEDLTFEERLRLQADPSEATLAELGLRKPLTRFEQSEPRSFGEKALTAIGGASRLIGEPIVQSAADVRIGIPETFKAKPQFDLKTFLSPTLNAEQRQFMEERRQRHLEEYGKLPGLERLAVELGVSLGIPATSLEIAGGRLVTSVIGGAFRRGAHLTSRLSRKLIRPGKAAEAAAPREINFVIVADEFPQGTTMAMPDTPANRAFLAEREAAGDVTLLPERFGPEDVRQAKQTLGIAVEDLPPSAVTEAEEALFTTTFERDTLREFTDPKLNPLARLSRRMFGFGKTEFGETLSPKQVRTLYHFLGRGQLPKAVSPEQALAEVRALYPTAVTSKGRVLPEYILDDVVTQYSKEYAGVGGVEQFLRDVEQAAKKPQELKALDVAIEGLEQQLQDLTQVPEAGVSPEFRAPVVAGRRVPLAMEGTPETGVQAGALGVPDRPVVPQGRGVTTQISMDDQLKLQAAREAGGAAPLITEGAPPGGGRVPPEQVIAEPSVPATAPKPPRIAEPPPQPPAPPEVPPPGGRAPGGGDEIAAVPDPGAASAFGFRPIVAGLTRTEKLLNRVRETIGRPFKAVPDDVLITPAMKERARARTNLTSIANTFSSKHSAQLKKVFKFDEKGGIPALAGIDPGVPGAPTVADVAARLSRYAPSLSEAQARALAQLQTEIAPFGAELRALDMDFGVRPDVMEGGFYVPRGNAAAEGFDEPFKVIVVGRRGKPGFERAAVFDSQAEGIAQGYEYATLLDSLRGYVTRGGSQALDKHIANYFSTLTDEGGKLFGATPKMRLLEQNPDIAAKMERLRTHVQRLQSAGVRLSERQNRAIQTFLDDPLGTETLQPGLFPSSEIDALEKSFKAIIIQRGRFAGLDFTGAQRQLRETRQLLKELAPAYNKAMVRARATPRGQGFFELPGLEQRTFPTEMANAANKVLLDEGIDRGPLSSVSRLVGGFNTLYRSMRSTYDNSAPGIQGLLAWADNPRAAAKALKVNLRAWGRGGEETIWAFYNDFDQMAREAGRLTSQEWTYVGVRQGGAQTEFAVPGLVGKIPGFKQANRAFGYFGDALRMNWSDDLLRGEMKRGRSLADIRARGDLDRIANMTNSATGWTRGRIGGAMGDLLLFAPRFLQSRLEIVARAAMSLRPGATLEQRVSRRALLKLIGEGTLLTVAVNEVLGNETDFKPIKNGRYNSNFMRIRFAGRDWSVFGTWDSLARAIVSTGTGDLKGVVRGMGSGLTTVAWNTITGKTFLGEEFKPAFKLEFARRAFETFSPFFLQELPEQIARGARGVREGQRTAIPETAATIAGEAFGAKSFPLSFTDIREEVTRELFNTDFASLNTAQKRQVNEHLRVKEAIERLPERGAATPQELTTFAVERWSAVKADLELDLRTKIEAGMRTKPLREAIQSLKEARFNASEALFSPEISEVLEGEGARNVWDVFAERYYDIDPAEDPVTGDIDFTSRDILREQILSEAEQRGVPRQFIIGTGDDTFRGKRFADPVVQQMVEAYERDVELLRPYWEQNEAITPLLSPQGQQVWQEYLFADSARKAQLRPRVSPIMHEVNRMKLDLRDQRPEIDVALLRWGYVTRPVTAEGAALVRELAGQRQVSETGGKLPQAQGVITKPSFNAGLAERQLQGAAR